MFDKEFTNNAAQPMKIKVIAAVDHSGTITRILASGGITGSTDDQRAEAMRMFQWAKATFVGQFLDVFYMHNGVVPSPSLHVPHVMPGSPRLEDLQLSAEDREKIARTFGMPYEQLAEYFNVPFKSAMTQPRANFYQTSGDVDFLKIDGVRFVVLDDLNPDAIAEALLTTPGALDAILSSLKEEELTGKPQEVNIELRVNSGGIIDDMEKMIEAMGNTPAWLRKVPMGMSGDSRAYSKDYGSGPDFSINSYWQSRTEPTKFYRVTGVQTCIGHSHIEMHCLQDGEPEDRVWSSATQWADLFTKVDRNTALAPLSPQSLRGPYTEHFDPAVLEARDAAQPVIDATQQMLDYVPFNGTEAPPKPGEQYQKLDSPYVYTVVDTQRADMGTYTITMDAHKGGVPYGRQKHAFRSHAQWLAKWRPVDSEGNVKPVEFVDIETDDKAVAAEVRELIKHENGTAIRWVNIIGRELDRRVPGWRDFDPPGVLYDDCALILRAIRTLNRHMLNYQKFADELREQNKAQLKTAEHHNKKMSQMTTWLNEMTRDATVSFKNTFGIEKTKELLKEFGYANVMSIPLADRASWVRKLREYAGMAGEL